MSAAVDRTGLAGAGSGIVRDQPPAEQIDAGPLAAYQGRRPVAPAWFEAAVSAPAEERSVIVEGARIAYRRWGDATRPGLLFVHGNGAHARWWDFIAPYLASQYNVAALSFSGMGDSGWRSAYRMRTFAEEEMAVMADAGMCTHDEKPIIVAHSFGGFVTMLTGAIYGDRLAGSIIVDSPVNPPERPHTGPPERVMRPHRVYPSLQAALARFRLAPPQPCDNHYILDYIARHSLKPADLPEGGQGWTWKFDPAIWTRFDAGHPPAELLKSTSCRIAIFRGEESILMPDDVREYMRALLNRQAPFISIPHARHHIMLDQPLAFVAALRTLLEDWDHSRPTRIVAGR